MLLAGFSTGGDTNIGNNYLFPGLAAVIVGGTMMGGRGDYLRTCLGALIITALNFVISVLNVNAAAAQVVFGALILLTVALYGRERIRDRVSVTTGPSPYAPPPSPRRPTRVTSAPGRQRVRLMHRNGGRPACQRHTMTASRLPALTSFARKLRTSMRLHHAGVSVPDLDRSLQWYCAALGLRPGYRFEVPPIGLRGAFALGDGDTGVELLEMAGAVPGAPKADPPSANAIHGYNHVCFHVTDLDAAYDQADRQRGGRGLGPARGARARDADGVRHRPGRQPHRAGRAGVREGQPMTPSFTGQLLRRTTPGSPMPPSAGSSTSGGRPPAPRRCCARSSTADVAAGVRLAAAEGLRVAVRAGGHSWAAWSLRDDTLLIDLADFATA